MDVQNIFYIVGIICMTLFIFILILITWILLYIKNKITFLCNQIEEKVEMAKELVTNPRHVATTIGTAVAARAINKATSFLNNKKK